MRKYLDIHIDEVMKKSGILVIILTIIAVIIKFGYAIIKYFLMVNENDYGSLFANLEVFGAKVVLVMGIRLAVIGILSGLLLFSIGSIIAYLKEIRNKLYD